MFGDDLMGYEMNGMNLCDLSASLIDFICLGGCCLILGYAICLNVSVVII